MLSPHRKRVPVTLEFLRALGYAKFFGALPLKGFPLSAFLSRAPFCKAFLSQGNYVPVCMGIERPFLQFQRDLVI